MIGGRMQTPLVKNEQKNVRIPWTPLIGLHSHLHLHIKRKYHGEFAHCWKVARIGERNRRDTFIAINQISCFRSAILPQPFPTPALSPVQGMDGDPGQWQLLVSMICRPRSILIWSFISSPVCCQTGVLPVGVSSFCDQHLVFPGLMFRRSRWR